MSFIDNRWLRDEEYYLKGDVSGAITLDRLNGNYQAATATGNFGGWTINNLPNGHGMVLALYGGGDWTPDWTGLTVFGTIPTLQTGNGIDFLELWQEDTTVYVMHLGAYVWGMPTDCVAWWGRNQLVDGKWQDQIGTHHLTLGGNANADRYTGLTLDGDSDYAQLVGTGIGTTINGSGAVSISWWQYADNPSFQAEQRVLSILINGEDVGLFVRQTTTSGTLEVKGRSQAADSNQGITATDTIAARIWEHYVAVWDYANKDLLLYKNGNATPIASNTNVTGWGSLTYTQGTPSVYDTLGAYAHTPSLYEWKGCVDDMQIYTRGLTTDEIAEIYKNNPWSHANTFWDVPEDCVLWTPLVNGTRLDVSGNDRHWEPINSPTIGDDGVALNGTTQYLTQSYFPYYKSDTTFSALLWVKASNPAATFAGLFGQYRQSGDQRAWVLSYYNPNSGKVRVGLTATGVWGPTTKDWYPADTTFDNTWHHVGITWQADPSGGVLHIYVDGVQSTPYNKVDNDTFAQILKSTVNLTVGAYCNGVYPFACTVANVMMFSRAITETEALDIYHQGRRVLPRLWGLFTDLVLWHHGDTVETDGKWTDHSGQNNHSTLYGTAAIEDTGLTLNGTGDYASAGVALMPISTADDPCSACAWIKVDSIGSNHVIIGQYDVAHANRWGFYVNTTGKLAYWRASTGSIIGGTALYADIWYHVGFVKEGNGVDEVTIYLNGNVDATGQDNGPFPNYHTRFGHFGNGASSYYDGFLDDVFIFNRAITPDELTNLMANSLGSHI